MCKTERVLPSQPFFQNGLVNKRENISILCYCVTRLQTVYSETLVPLTKQKKVSSFPSTICIPYTEIQVALSRLGGSSHEGSVTDTLP